MHQSLTQFVSIHIIQKHVNNQLVLLNYYCIVC